MNRGGIKLFAGGWNQELKILAGSFLNIIFYWPFFSIKYYIWLRKTSHLKFDKSNSLDPEQMFGFFARFRYFAGSSISILLNKSSMILIRLATYRLFAFVDFESWLPLLTWLPLLYKWLMEIQITWLPLLNNSIIWNLAWKSWKLKLKNYSVSALAEFAGWQLYNFGWKNSSQG